MKRKTAAVGALLLVVAGFLYTNPSMTAALSNNLGAVGTDMILDRNNVVPILPMNYSYLAVGLSTGDSLSVVLNTNPTNVDVLLMNQGNFSSFSLSGRGSFSTYPQSMLHVSNYTFTFMNSEQKQSFYVVFVSHSTGQPTDVLAHTVVSRQSVIGAFLFPIVFGLAGILALGYSFKRKKEDVKPPPTKPASKPIEDSPVASAKGLLFCRHCGAALRAGSQFCLACNKSQN